MKNIKSKFYNLKSKRGFVSLFAVLISLIILAITIGISTIAYKENVLALSAQEGSYAFFAADTGLECALYYDSLEVFGLPNQPMPINPNINCASLGIVTNTDPIDESFSFSFDVVMGNPDLDPLIQSRCVEVKIRKKTSGGISVTKIYSNGYNVACSVLAGSSNSRIVNRLLTATYPNPVPPLPPTTP